MIVVDRRYGSGMERKRSDDKKRLSRQKATGGVRMIAGGLVGLYNIGSDARGPKHNTEWNIEKPDWGDIV